LPGNSRDDRAYLRKSGMTRPKTGIYISGYTGPIFAIFTPFESALRADDGSVYLFSNLSRDVAMATK